MTDATLDQVGAAPAPPPAEGRVGWRTKVGFVAMVFGMFMAILDIQIVSASLAEIQAGVSASADEIVWVQTAYLIAEVVMIPLSGYLSRLLSTRILFTASALGFTAMSLACAYAGSIESLVFYRALQGFLGGAMIPTVFATTFTAFPPRNRTGVTVIIGLVATLAPTIGPTLGGWLTASFSWHWLFLVNIVPGLLVAGAVWTLMDLDRPDWSLLKGIDLGGLALMALFLGSLEYVIEEGARHNWFEEEKIRTMAVVAVIAGIGFLWRALTHSNPIVDLRALRDRNFAMGCLYGFIIGIGLYGSVYVLPLFLGQVRELNSLQIGQVMMVTGICQFLAAPFAGVLSNKIDVRIVISIGLALLATSFLLTLGVTADWDKAEWMLPQMVRGFGLMFCIIPITSLALGTLSPDQLKNASGLFNLMRNLGGAFGLAGINTIITERLALHTQRLSEWVDLTRPVMAGHLENLAASLQGALGSDAQAAALKLMAGTVRREAVVMTFSDLFLLMGALFVVTLLTMPLVRKPRAAGGPGGGPGAGGH
ncbi:MAG TPA: DHA2 family efflux MFS transporter permease subunit [Azospirillaceae bacterium]|nr:DHA2 family efflux MFS transporter permease subunit [Azospirillaceae bacterium]